MAEHLTRSVPQRSRPFATGATRQNWGIGGGSPSLRTAEMLPSARDLLMVDSALTVVGGDVVHDHSRHYHYDRPRDIWAILQSIPNFRQIYQDMLSKATEGTGMWLVKGDRFRLWLEPNGDIKIFWGSGIPGAGKTLLASIVIEHLEVLCKATDVKICVCYVYFRYSDRAAMTVRTLVEEAYAQHLREGTEPTEAQMLALLHQLTKCMSITFYVLDALDEAPTKIQLLVVKTLASLNVKLFITSRPLKVVEANFSGVQAFHIFAQDADINLHIARRINENAELQRLLQDKPALRDEIISTIKRNCGGMFLHASLQLEALSECLSARDMRDTLKVFPPDIMEVYCQTWARISSQSLKHASLAKAVLIWVLNASRSMTIEELELAASTSPETHKFDPAQLVPGATLVSLCGGLITVEEESRLLRLVHYTAKDTLESLIHEAFPHPHSFLAAVCMTHLTECGFQDTTITSEQEFKSVLKNDPLLAYASEAWAFHARAGLDIEDTKRQTAQFVTESNAFPAFTSFERTFYFDILAPLHILGLCDLPLALIEDPINPNLTTEVLQQSALILASRLGHERLLALLLAKSEIQVNLINNNGWSALMEASRYGHTSIVVLLLAHPRIQVNLVNIKGRSALMMAAREGHECTAKLLLAHPDIQVNLVDDEGWPALLLAARDGYEGTVKQLLAHPDTLVNLVNNKGWSALMKAIRNGHEGTAKLLLAHPDIQVNLVDNKGRSALMKASKNGHESTVKLLLAHRGIQVNLVDNKGRLALMRAARYGYEGTVKQLLAYPDTQVNLVNNKGRSALMKAIRNGHGSIAKLLLAHPDIQVNLVSNEGWSALMMAAREGYEGTMKLLLAHPDIQVNLVDSNGWSALMKAARDGYEAVACLLLNVPNVDITIRSTRDGHTAMSVAQARGCSGIVQLLQDFESRKATVASPLGTHPLSTNNSYTEDGSDSDSSGHYFDAEDSFGQDVDRGEAVI
ncbi:ankyrin repeat-containing domain protein [Coprinopsis sp. MPI-PUGE-AT-0042]|nr:ankyrin repeat-containing domain protein [Coprinopsis sp. MPI-PUGE-AT-0042]